MLLLLQNKTKIKLREYNLVVILHYYHNSKTLEQINKKEPYIKQYKKT